MHCEGKLKLSSHNTSYCLLEVVTKADLTVYICKIQIDVQPLIGVQFSNIRSFFAFSNRRPITSLTYTSNYVTPVKTWFCNNDGEGTKPDSEYIVHITLADPNPNPNLTLTLILA